MNVAPVEPEASEAATVARTFAYVRTVAAEYAALTLALLLSAMRSVNKIGNVKFPFLHAKDGCFGDQPQVKRFNVRAVQCDAIGETLSDGSRPCNNFTFFGMVLNQAGESIDAYARAYRLAVDAHIRIVTRDNTDGACDSLQGNGSYNTQCANAARSAFTIVVGRDGTYALDVSYVKGGGGGFYRVSCALDSNGAPLASF